MKQENLNINTQCPRCQEFITVRSKVTIDDDALVVPKVRSGLAPISTIKVYKITTDDMRKFIVDKVHAIAPSTVVDVMPRFSQKKKSKSISPRCYASLRIGLSEEAIDRRGDEGWYTKAAESDTNIRFVSTLYKDIIQRYQYNYDEVRKWLNSYDDLEKLENQLGITQEFLNDIKKFCRPQRIVASDEQWIMFAAAPENVIYDMLTDVNTNKLIGGIQICSVNQLSKDLVEYTVYVHPQQLSTGVDPKIRQILLGEEKPKKA